LNLEKACSRRCSACRKRTSASSPLVGSGFGSARAMDAMSPRRRRRTAVGQAGETRGQPKDDVPAERQPRPHSAARAPGRHGRRQTRLAPARLCHQRSILDAHHEDCGEATPLQYSVPNLRVTFGRARRNVGAATDMRGPGRVPGLYATESAMNELADQLKIDPVKRRVINEPKIDESLGIRSRRAICSSALNWARRSSAGPSARPKLAQ
jgi:hypothetical protein